MNQTYVYKGIALSFVALMALLSPLTSAASDREIQVVGKSEVSVTPDMAHFTFAINGRSQDLKSLKAGIDQKTANLVRSCKRLGVLSKQISSTKVSIRPQYNYQTKEFLGYEVSRDVKVTLSQLDKYTELVNGAIESGITTVSNITLDSSQRDHLEQRALSAAVDSAHYKAQALAERADVKLGKVVGIIEGGARVEHSKYQFRESSMVMSQAQGAFEPGEISVNASLTVIYAIE
jgi:uncharacterized protein